MVTEFRFLNSNLCDLASFFFYYRRQELCGQVVSTWRMGDVLSGNFQKSRALSMDPK